MTKTPSSLLDRLRQPFQAEAWEQFVSLYAPLLYAWGRQVGLQDNDAADLAQEVMVTLLRVLPSFSYDRHQSFRKWLRTVALNKWRNARKRPGQRVQLRSGDLEPLAGPAEEAFWEVDYRRHLAARALAVMQRDFQETTWRACWETVVNDRPAAEVAAELGLTVGAVHAARFRVLGRLREELRGLLD